MEWKILDVINHNYQTNSDAPFDGKPFLACIWGNDEAGSWVGEAVYARHYEAGDRRPSKYEFFYVTQNPERDGWQIRIEEKPFPITHWMPLPPSPNNKT